MMSSHSLEFHVQWENINVRDIIDVLSKRKEAVNSTGVVLWEPSEQLVKGWKDKNQTKSDIVEEQ